MVFKKLLLVVLFDFSIAGFCALSIFLIWTKLLLSEECNFTPNNLHYSAI